MSDMDQFSVDKFIAFIEKSPEYREKLANLFYPSEFAKKDELTRILEEMEKNRIETNKRIDQVDKRIEQVDKRIEQVDKRIDDMQKNMDKRFEQVDKRIDDMQKNMDKRFELVDKRFEQVDKRFDDMQKNMDYKFDKVFSRFDDLSLSLGHDFEEFNSLWLQEYLMVQGFQKLNIRKRTFYDKNYTVFPDNKDIEIDIFNEDPLIIGEVTAITKTIAKVNIFLKKVQFIERMYEQKAHTRLFITYAFKPEIREEAISLLEKNDVKLFVLRQRGYEEL